MSAKILFVEDEDSLRDVLLEAAALENYDAVGVSSAEAALELLSQDAFDIVVTDIMLGSGMSGLDLLPRLLQKYPTLVVIVITAFGTIDVAVEAMKRGASDFVTKPFAINTFNGLIRVAAERAANNKRIASAALPSNGGSAASSEIIGTSPALRKLLDQVAAIAPFMTTVLVTGETGTGKELVARHLHRMSPRRARQMVALNCAAVPEQLLEDELFGHVKGAFTGAQSAREGRFEQAHGGTLFLDEIGDMSLPLQSKLLRVLQEREFEKLGSARTLKVDVRIVAATSANLERRIEEGSFRPDLYYRLNVVHLRLPSLRERISDIRLLAEQLLMRFCESSGIPPKTVDESVWNALCSYRWPGNVRQLQNAMERAAALSGAGTTISLDDLPEEVRGGAVQGVTPALQTERAAMAAAQQMPEDGVSFDAVVTNVERELLLQSLSKAGGNKMRAAKLLNMKRTTFVEKLKRLQIDGDEKADAVEENADV